MEDNNEIHSRKRKKKDAFSSNFNLLIGVSTRSQSRAYLNQNRSALTKSDPVSVKSIHHSLSVGAFLDTNCGDASRVSSVKDLRMKRVFTPEINSVPQEENDEEENDSRKELSSGSDAVQVVGPDVDDVKVDELAKSGLVKPEAEDEQNGIKNCVNSKDQAISGNEFLSAKKLVLNRCCRKKVFNTSSSFSYRRLLPYLMDIVKDDSSVPKIEIVDGVNSLLRSTAENRCGAKIEPVLPSDDSKVLKYQDIQMEENDHDNHMNGVGASSEEHIQTTPPDPENQTFVGLSAGSAKSNGDALKQSPNSKRLTNSMDRSVLRPCSRQRLFKNPRSLSYRRMLPFLMDISKSTSCASRNTQHPIAQLVLEEEKYVNNNKTEDSDEKEHAEDFTRDSASYVFPLPPSDASTPDDNDLQTEEVPQIWCNPTKSQQGVDSKDSILPLGPSSTVNEDILTKQCISEESESVQKQEWASDMGLEPRSCSAESIEKINLKQNLFLDEAHSDTLVCLNKPPKGILKRNRLGCRGLCNCLNCASFRLHADRAFEFSRNQLHDAEEVASELMKELASLRLLLERSIIGTNGSACIQLHPLLAKEACNKALETEKLAKESLTELNHDLNAHCRIPALLQPKVTFANKTQERAIPVSDPSTSGDKKE